MGQHILPGNPPISVALRRSARARKLSLRVSRLDGRVTLTLPRGVPDREGLTFLRSREDWLRGHLGRVGAEVRPLIGGTILFGGVEVPILTGPVKRLQFQDNCFVLPDDPARVAPRLGAFLKTQARDRLAAASDHYAAALGRPYHKLTLRDTRSRWGSCSAAGDLMYSWRLIMAPPQVLDYVAAHEVAHLAEMNHSDRFWAVVDRLFPAHQECRRWLRENGEALHRMRFEGGK
jgi:predicted metal-dependent hydrolase